MLGCAVKLLDLWQILDHPPEQPEFYVCVRQWITHDGAAFRGNVRANQHAKHSSAPHASRIPQ